MALSINGTVLDRTTGRLAVGLWGEVRHDDRVVARAAEATDDAGRFRIAVDDGALREILGDRRTVLTVAVLRDDGTEITLTEPAVVNWPPEGERVEVELAVELPPEERPPVRIEDMSGVLARPVPDALLNRLRDRRIRTLADIRAAGGLSRLDGLTEAQERAARTLEAHARLDVVSTDGALNARLVEAGVGSVTALARADVAAVAEAAGVEPEAVGALKERAIAQRWVVDHQLADVLITVAPVNSSYRFNKELPDPKQHWGFELLSPQPAPDACRSCAACASALSPAAYLVDLVDFLIDTFKDQVYSTSSTVQPKGFPDLKAIEDRFYRPFGSLVVDCETADQPIRQIEIAIEALERFVQHAAAQDRKTVYAAFGAMSGAQPRFPKPDVLSNMFDAYLGDLGVARADFDAAIAEAYPAGSGQPDKTKLNALLTQLGVTEATLAKGLDLKGNWKPHIEALDWLPQLVRAAKTKGLDRNDVAQLAAYTDALAQAEAAVGRVKDYALPDIRANLISYALYPLIGTNPRNPAITTARQLGNYLHIDLEVEPCAHTTRLASAIEALQSWVEAFRTGREDPGYYLMFYSPADQFELVWDWLRSYGTWQAAQSVLLYPENFLLPSVRQERSEAFKSLLDELAGTGTDRALIQDAVDACRVRIACRYLLAQLMPGGGEAVDEAPVVRALGATLGTMPPNPTWQQYQDATAKLVAQLVQSKLPEEQVKQALSGNWSLSTVLAGYRSLRKHPTPRQGRGLDAFHAFQKTAYVSWILDEERSEWYFYAPLAVAAHLNDERAYEDAAAWLHNVFYPFAGQYPADLPNPPVRLVWAGFSAVRDPGYAYRNTLKWLTDPFNPFAIARVRDGAFVRHVIITYVENLLDWADTEFGRDTAESIARARELYELAEMLVGVGEFTPEDACRAAWGDLLAQVAATHTPEQARLLLLVLDPLTRMDGRLRRSDLTKAGEILAKAKPFADRAKELKQLVDDVKARPTLAKTVDELRDEQATCQLPELVTEDAFNANGNGHVLVFPGQIEVAAETGVASRSMRKIGCGFCVPPNPLLTTLRFRAETNLEKIRTCRNIAGLRRAVQIYAPSADPMAVVQATAAGAEIEEAVPSEPPPVHRFSYLIERARYYADVARQLESQLLNAFEREDQEKYTLLQAKQGMRAAGANLSLQDLRVGEADHGVILAQHQRDRAAAQKKHFDDLLADKGLAAEYEKDQIRRMWLAHNWAIAATAAAAAYGAYSGAMQGLVTGAAGTGAILGAAAATTQGLVSVHNLAAQISATKATFERRREEWTLQRDLAEWDRKIGEQSSILANDRVDIVKQEREIARLQGEFAREVVEFLGSKFTNAQLWQWMGKTLRRHYRDHLTFATVTARMAQRALEFERQEPIPIVAPVYAEREKRDLLAAEQLLTDINKLDQHRLTTERRRKELTKTISLAQLDPIGFNAIRQGHGMTFTTLLSLFDRDFPGHYLRLVKSISLTVVALVPPNESIHATLSNAGISRVVVGPPFDQPRVIQRQPESIAVTAASNGTGLFELRFDDPILLPFEGAGVETTWTLDLPQGANRFDFGTLADVLFTVRYTALEDATYREKVLKQMGMTANRKLAAGGAVSFPLRTALPDEWFDLYHPQFVQDPDDYGFGPSKVKPPYLMQFELRPGDFPPNELDHALTRLNVAFRQSRTVPVPLEIWFNPAGKTDEYALEADYTWDPADPNSGPVSIAAFARHRPDSQATWQMVVTTMGQLAPFGTWRLRLRNEDADPDLLDGQEHSQNKLKLDWLEDLLFVVAYDASVEYRYAS